MKTYNDLSNKQKSVVENNNITVTQSEDHNSLFYFFYRGVYYQQNGYVSEYDAYVAGIDQVINK